MTSTSTARPSKAPDVPPESRRSDYIRYRQYHDRPPSPPPPTSAAPSTAKRTIDAPNTIEYIVGKSFKQNPNPGATKAYSEVSVADSRPPASRVTFIESEVSAIDGVKVRDERYRTKNVERVVIDSERDSRSASSAGRRKEREESVEYEYAYRR